MIPFNKRDMITLVHLILYKYRYILEIESLITQANRETSCVCVFAINLAIYNIANRPKSDERNYRRQTNCGEIENYDCVKLIIPLFIEFMAGGTM